MYILQASLVELNRRRYLGVEEGTGSVCVSHKSMLLRPFL